MGLPFVGKSVTDSRTDAVPARAEAYGAVTRDLRPCGGGPGRAGRTGGTKVPRVREVLHCHRVRPRPDAERVNRTTGRAEEPKMKRRTLDIMFSAGGLVLAVLLLVVGIVMTSNANFAKDYVSTQLSQQNITFKTADQLTGEEKNSACL